MCVRASGLTARRRPATGRDPYGSPPCERARHPKCVEEQLRGLRVLEHRGQLVGESGAGLERCHRRPAAPLRGDGDVGTSSAPQSRRRAAGADTIRAAAAAATGPSPASSPAKSMWYAGHHRELRRPRNRVEMDQLRNRAASWARTSSIDTGASIARRGEPDNPNHVPLRLIPSTTVPSIERWSTRQTAAREWRTRLRRRVFSILWVVNRQRTCVRSESTELRTTENAVAMTYANNDAPASLRSNAQTHRLPAFLGNISYETTGSSR